jgi:hypothetical protein
MALVITTPAICREHEGKAPHWTRAQARRVLRELRSPGAGLTYRCSGCRLWFCGHHARTVQRITTERIERDGSACRMEPTR